MDQGDKKCLTKLNYSIDELACQLLMEHMHTTDKGIAVSCLSIIGLLCEASEEVCTKLVCNVPQLRLLESLQHLMANFGNDTRAKTLWLISNIAVNSEADAMQIVKSGILGNVSIACLDNDSKVKDEALWAMSSIIVSLNDPIELS